MTIKEVTELKRLIVRGGSILALVLLAVSLEALPAGAQLARPEEVVRITPALPKSGFTPGETFQAALILDILDGYHLNAHGIKDPNLIRTELEIPAGGTVSWPFIRYPEDQAAPGVEVPGLVDEQYVGRIVLRLVGRLPREAVPGPLPVKMSLYFQACTDLVCLVPYNQRFELEIPVVAPGTAVKTLHPEIFGQGKVPPGGR
jgi:thiol:disulfide interchange protein DsbD